MKNQMFIKIDEYKELLDLIDVFKTKLAETKSNLNQINSIREEEENELKSWRENLKEIESKLISIDKNLFNPEE